MVTQEQVNTVMLALLSKLNEWKSPDALASAIESALNEVGEYRCWTAGEVKELRQSLHETAPYLSEEAINELATAALDVIGGFVALKVKVPKPETKKKKKKPVKVPSYYTQHGFAIYDDDEEK